MTFGTLFYLVGFTMYGFTTTYPLFLLAMVIITIGEMIVSPTSTALVARLAPMDMRGRYMAVSGFSWIIPSAIGPLLAGFIMDNYDPRWLWYLCGILAAISTFGFLILSRSASDRLQHEAVQNAGK
jgi:MFS family permease